MDQLSPYGLRSKYVLGKNTQKRYPEFFSRYLNSDEINARSVDTDQDIIGTQAQLMGMFEDFRTKNFSMFNSEHSSKLM